MNTFELSQELIDFIGQCPSMFHTVASIARKLDQAGFTYLNEGCAWKLEKGGKYYTTRNGSSIIAFQIGKEIEDYHFQMTASHSDSPTYKIKTVPELKGPGDYLKLNVEAYGGMIDSSWFDRPLTVAGRVLVRKENRMENLLVFLDKDLLIIPNLCIHFNRKVNEGMAYNRQVDLCPLFSNGACTIGDFDRMVAEAAGVEVEEILGKDLYLVNRQVPCIWGYQNEFVSSPKLDDLQCAFASLKAFLQAQNEQVINVYCCFDNEEVGSNTKQGAMSTFLQDTLKRINLKLGKTEEDYHMAIAKSFLVSCDNAHAVHPNHPEKSDVENSPFMNKGIVIKENANQKYTTDAISRAIFTGICKDHDIPVQTFANRSDAGGGSTLGNLSNMQVSVHAVDVGIAQLAMHSSYETCGVEDTNNAVRALTAFYNTKIEMPVE